MIQIDTTENNSIPMFLRLTAAQRAAAWERNPPKTMTVFAEDRAKDPEAERMLAEKEAVDKIKANNRIHKMKANLAPPIDTKNMVWNQRRCRWEVPAWTISAPGTKTPRKAKGRPGRKS